MKKAWKTLKQKKGEKSDGYQKNRKETNCKSKCPNIQEK